MSQELVGMETREAKEITQFVKEVSKDHIALTSSISTVAHGISAAKKLSKNGNKNILIKAGLALIVFPEPVVSDMLGTALLAAGTVQEGIKRQSIYLDDLPKALKSALRDLKSTKDLI